MAFREAILHPQFRNGLAWVNSFDAEKPFPPCRMRSPFEQMPAAAGAIWLSEALRRARMWSGLFQLAERGDLVSVREEKRYARAFCRAFHSR
jgi:hypothetical protein